jgi:hypothetical protein
MSTEVIYARVPAALKEAADEYASQHGKTLTGAVVDLLDRGLVAVTDERSVRDLEANLARVTAEKARAEADLRTAETQLAALGTLADRAKRSVGRCPHCSAQVTGHDLLAVGQCPQCGQPLSELTAAQPAGPALDQREVLMLMGTLGAVLAIAYLASK